jgi:FKBP-type peptidyl-prolyl cis-trans isomerase FklB
MPRRIAFALSMLVLLPRAVAASPAAAEPAASLTGITVSFKLDPRTIDPTHGGMQWVSPRTYSGANAQDTVEARAQGVDAKGGLSAVSARWIASDPTMVNVSPSQGNEVRLVVRRAGQSTVKVVSGRVSQVLAVQSSHRGKFIQVAITQLRDLKPPSPSPANTASAPNSPLAEKQKESEVTLPSGLRYKILKKASGQTPTEDDVVECRYRISAPNGQELDASPASQPVTFSVAEARWKEALKLMPVGSKWQIVVPPRRVPSGDRPRGRWRAGSTVRFSSALIVEVELLAIKKAPEPGKRAAAASSPEASGVGISL